MSNTTFEHKDHWPILSNIEEMYDGDFLINCSLFEGGFINFGYWEKEIGNQQLSIKDRLESAQNLYKKVLEKAGICHNDHVLEVACGAGSGAALLLKEFIPKEYKGLDVSSSQIARAKNLNLWAKELASFHIGKAEEIPFTNQSFNKIFSIEAAQHFKSLPSFIKEAYRVLKPNGVLVVSTFFAMADEISNKAIEMIPTLRDKVDTLYPILKVQKLLQEEGFNEVSAESIGANVWHGFDSWIAQGEFKDSWDRNWYKGYKEGLFDYYIISAKKSK